MMARRPPTGPAYVVYGKRAPQIRVIQLIRFDEDAYYHLDKFGDTRRLSKTKMTKVGAELFFTHGEAVSCKMARLRREVDRTQAELDKAWAAVRTAIDEEGL
jgi:hypothetical protein